MLYFSGAIRKELISKPEFGFMYTPRMGNRFIPGCRWMADTGLYTSGYFSLKKYLSWLDGRDRARCYGCTAPDRLADPQETLRLSLPVLPQIRKLGYLAAFVLQDKATPDQIPWDEFDVLFIGGTTRWKLSLKVQQICREAIQKQKRIHMGRVNSCCRFLYAFRLGCTSVDGTHIRFKPKEHIRQIEQWNHRLFSLIPVHWTHSAFKRVMYK